MNKALARFQITVVRALAGLRRQLARAAASIRPLAAQAWAHLRHPTRRGVALALAAVPVLVLLYVLLLIPFTPGISDLRKAKSGGPRGGAVGRRQGAGRVQARQPRLGHAPGHLAARVWLR